MKNQIIHIEKGSIAEEIGIEKGDALVAINDNQIIDVFDYRYHLKDEYIEVLIEKINGSSILYEIEKEEEEDLGLLFENGLIDNAKSCKNKCIFCFIDQLPPLMRETLYFKDDDSRLSFLQGNYVTLTNMEEEEFKRIIFYHLSPINISVHSTDPAIREFMLKNPNSVNLMKYLNMLYEANIEMNFQVVLCKGQNDKENLDQTIKDLSSFLPKGKSLSVVPVGLTKYREKLFQLEPFTKNDSFNIIKQVENWNEKFQKEFGTSFVYASDEFYLKAGLNIPHSTYYENFPQIENGVGMMALFREELRDAIKAEKESSIHRKVSIITGVLAFPFLQEMMVEVKEICPHIQIEIIPIVNNFFGEEITVSGLLTGKDIMAQLKDKDLGEKLLIPLNAFKANENIFLDDVNLETLENELQICVKAVKVSGAALLHEIISKETSRKKETECLNL